MFSSERTKLERTNIENIGMKLEKTERSDAGVKLEKVFAADGTKTIHWYLSGLKRCDSIARIETLDGKGYGTGWLVNSEDFGFQGGKLLISNAHVISDNAPDQGLAPDRLQARFQQLNRVVPLGRIVWWSSQNELDATFVTLAEDVPAQPIPVNPRPLELANPMPRVYIIGHPGGRDLEFSIHDNRIVAITDRFLHYRASTDEGSSGSPVFDEDGWRAVALHHAGLFDMPRIDGKPGRYQANEGVSLLEVKRAIARTPP